MRARDLGAALFGVALLAGVLGLAGWLLDLGDVVRVALTGVSWIDLVVGTFCLAWFFVLLKAPWDLYFQALAVSDEMQRSREAGIKADAPREAYVRRLRRRLLVLAISAHVVSAALAAAVALFGGGIAGFWFSAFYLVSTAFRPLVSAYRHLMRRLRQLFTEARFPREDVLEMRSRVERHDEELPALRKEVERLEKALDAEREERQVNDRELRGHVAATARELETTLARLTDNQEVVKGIQAFVRLVSNASRP